MQQKLPVKKLDSLLGLVIPSGSWRCCIVCPLLYGSPGKRIQPDSLFFFFRVEVVLKKDDYSKEFQFQDLGRLVK